jgi:hypothetical protein
MVNLNPITPKWAPILYKHGVCHRCAGEGVVKPYPHIDGGICFKCHGHRFVMIKDSYKPIIELWRKNTRTGSRYSFQEIVVLHEYFTIKKKNPEFFTNCPICGTPDLTIQDIAFGCCDHCFAELKGE